MKWAIAGLICLFAVGALAADLAGEWSGSFRATGGDHDIPQLFTFKQDGTRLTGSGGPDAREQYPVENGRVESDRVRFEVTTGEWKFAYDLKFTAPDKLSGDLVMTGINDRRTAKVSLRRTKR